MSDEASHTTLEEDARALANEISELRRTPGVPSLPAPTMFDQVLAQLLELMDLPLVGEHNYPEATGPSLAPPIHGMPDDRLSALSDCLRSVRDAVMRVPGSAVDLEAATDLLIEFEAEIIDAGTDLLGQLSPGAVPVATFQNALQRLRFYAEQVTQWKKIRSIQKNADMAAEAAQSATESAEIARGKTGETGAVNLAHYFGKLAKRERSTAAWFRFLAILPPVAIAVLTISQGAPGEFNLAEGVWHVSIALVGLALSGYLAAEASRHRRAAMWAESVEVQLQTVTQYCAPLEPGAQQRVMELLAARAFGSSPDELKPSSEESAASLTPGLLEQIASIVRASKT